MHPSCAAAKQDAAGTISSYGCRFPKNSNHGWESRNKKHPMHRWLWCMLGPQVVWINPQPSSTVYLRRQVHVWCNVCKKSFVQVQSFNDWVHSIFQASLCVIAIFGNLLNLLSKTFTLSAASRKTFLLLQNYFEQEKVLETCCLKRSWAPFTIAVEYTGLHTALFEWSPPARIFSNAISIERGIFIWGVVEHTSWLCKFIYHVQSVFQGSFNVPVVQITV